MPTERSAVPFTILLIIAALVGGVIVVSQRGGAPRRATAAASHEEARALEPAKRYKIPVSRTQPSVGPDDALVTIVEWCDLRGAACVRSDELIAAVLAKHPAQARRTFRHFTKPDQQAQLGHELGGMAHEQAGKFWEVRAWVAQLDHDPSLAECEGFAAKLGLDPQQTKTVFDQHRFFGRIVADRAFAQMFDVTHAPALFVNGRRVPSKEGEAPSAEDLERLVDDELKAAGALVQGGVTRDRVYAELTKNGVWTPPRRDAKASSEPQTAR